MDRVGKGGGNHRSQEENTNPTRGYTPRHAWPRRGGQGGSTPPRNGGKGK